MALPILDGNQTAVTLATTVSGGAHYPNHIIASGTVTANSSSQYFNGQSGVTYSYALASWTDGGEIIGSSYSDPVPVQLVQLGNTPSEIFTARIGNSVTVGSLPVQLSTTTIGGTARLNVTLSSATTVGGAAPSYANLYGGSDGTNLRAILVDSSGRTTVTGSVGIIGTPSVTMGAISGTVTANVASTTVTVSALPSGALTTRFGSCTTANTVQLSSAVTNTARKYLLIQNISTGTVTVGIGHAATTTQGIQLAAGAGLTFDSFCPTGGVWVLSGVTAGPWAIYEG